jgi:hypothetical protein
MNLTNYELENKQKLDTLLVEQGMMHAKHEMD